MRVMGIDPGIAATGYGIISQQRHKLELHCADTIKTSNNLSLSERLQVIHSILSECIEQYNPQAIAIEELFVARNYKMAINLGQAMGVARLAAAQAQLPVFSYSVLRIKQAVVGYGRAGKEQVQAMVKVLLNMSGPPSSEHEADALAVAICHLHSGSLQAKIEAKK